MADSVASHERVVLDKIEEIQIFPQNIYHSSGQMHVELVLSFETIRICIVIRQLRREASHIQLHEYSTIVLFTTINLALIIAWSKRQRGLQPRILRFHGLLMHF